MDKRINEYMNLIVKSGLNVQPGDKVVINAATEIDSFVETLIPKIYDAGASLVMVDWLNENINKIKYLNEPLENFGTIDDYIIKKVDYKVDNNFKYLILVSRDPNALKGIDSKKVSTFNKAFFKACGHEFNFRIQNKTSWSIAAVPGKNWADVVFPSRRDAIDKLWELILETSRCNYENPLEVWNTHIESLKQRAEKLTSLNLKYLVVKSSLGTDIKINLADGHIWTAAASKNTTTGDTFCPNIPTEEVFTVPDCKHVDGIVYASKPLIYDGNLIEDFYFKFEAGKVVDYGAKVGQEYLDGMLSIDENAKYLGEVALVSKESPINKLNTIFYSTLFDENASCHLALGNGFPTAVKETEGKNKEELLNMGINNSAIHVDFMFGTEDLKVIGFDQNNKEIEIMLNGDFTF